MSHDSSRNFLGGEVSLFQVRVQLSTRPNGLMMTTGLIRRLTGWTTVHRRRRVVRTERLEFREGNAVLFLPRSFGRGNIRDRGGGGRTRRRRDRIEIFSVCASAGAKRRKSESSADDRRSDADADKGDDGDVCACACVLPVRGASTSDRWTNDHPNPSLHPNIVKRGKKTRIGSGSVKYPIGFFPKETRRDVETKNTTDGSHSCRALR